MAQADLSARRAALSYLAGVLGRRRMLSEVEVRTGRPEERARALRLATAVLRNLGRADTVLNPRLQKSPPLAVRNALRLAVVEMAVFGAPPHGAVSSAVEILRRSPKNRSFAGLANAVLRKAAEGLDATWAALPPDRLPSWIRTPIVKAWGAEAAGRIEAVQALAPPTDLTPGPAMTPAVRAALGASVLPTGSLRLAAPGQITALAGYAGGAFWVQDAAAALPAKVLNARPNERVLDLCAAPGGKTMQLAASGADVVAVDISADRMTVLKENLARTGLSAECVVADLETWSPDGPADAILLDAPCSATGTIRRHPDLPQVKTGAGIRDLFALQARLIDRAAGWLKPGGRLVYSTCSLLVHEGERQAEAALDRIPGLGIDLGAVDIPGVDAAWRTDFGLRLRPDFWPDLGGMDGFFIAAFTKD